MGCVLDLRRTILTVFGLVATVVGWGMWQEPQLDSYTMGSLIADEVYRLAGDSFAVLGLMIMLLGLWLVFMLSGPWTLLRGRDSSNEGREIDREKESQEFELETL